MTDGAGCGVSIEGGGLVAHVEDLCDQGFRLVFLGPARARCIPPTGARHLPASPDRPVNPGLASVRGAGYTGSGVLDAFFPETGIAISLQSAGIRKLTGSSLVLTSQDISSNFRLQIVLDLGPQGLRVSTRLENGTGRAVAVNRAASLLLPLPDWAASARLTYGSWAREGFSETLPLNCWAIERVSRLGRTGFGGPPLMVLLDKDACLHPGSGRGLGVDLAWSGSHRLRAERFVDGSSELVAEALFEPGEIILRPGEVFTLPDAFISLSDCGIEGLRKAFWCSLRTLVPPSGRPVHFNTWEACYFGFDEARLMALAGAAARIGAERFVLDDGWFCGRRDDSAALGDWDADPMRFPRGLAPLINHVQGLGMRFGLWIEPEMVSRDSDLYRAHPEWVLGWPEENLPTGRNQLVLNLANEAVRAYLFEKISNLLRGGDIDYLKWDCNRELYPARYHGRNTAHQHVEGVYALMRRVRETFPDVEIESCASGGARIDRGILRYASRVWPSDATDAIDRVRIQSALTDYLPIEMIGAHIGPSPNPITGRRLSMSFRVLVAMFGHLGIEGDPFSMTEDEQDCLRCGVLLYKRLREEMHSACLQKLPASDQHLEVTLLNTREGNALLRVLRMETSYRARPALVPVPGLDPASSYEVSEFTLDPSEERIVGSYSGAALAWAGLDADPCLPASGRLFYLRRMEGERA